MRILSSLTNRIFLGSAALAVLTIAVAVYRINVAVTVQAENELRRGLEEAGTQLEENRDTLFAHFFARGPPHLRPVESQGGDATPVTRRRSSRSR